MSSRINYQTKTIRSCRSKGKIFHKRGLLFLVVLSLLFVLTKQTAADEVSRQVSLFEDLAIGPVGKSGEKIVLKWEQRVDIFPYVLPSQREVDVLIEQLDLFQPLTNLEFKLIQKGVPNIVVVFSDDIFGLMRDRFQDVIIHFLGTKERGAIEAYIESLKEANIQCVANNSRMNGSMNLGFIFADISTSRERLSACINNSFSIVLGLIGKRSFQNLMKRGGGESLLINEEEKATLKLLYHRSISSGEGAKSVLRKVKNILVSKKLSGAGQ